MLDFLVVGAGFAGSVTAERLAAAGARVCVIDRRTHLGGAAYDEYDDFGVLIHRYGPHIFHTNSDEVMGYLSRFTEWRPYEHRVLAFVDQRLVPFPINRTTLNTLYGLDLDETGVNHFLEQVRVPRDRVVSSEDLVLNLVGRDLYEKFFRGYTRKQWGVDPCHLAASVCGRIPVRTGTNDCYFTDRFQVMPLEGYTRMFQRILDHPRITVKLGTDFSNLRRSARAARVVYTGPIDAYFNFCLGHLPYRSLWFEHLHFPDIERYQPVATVNYPGDVSYTRITEFKHLTGQQHPGTSIVREHPQAEGDPYYPIPNDANAALYNCYEELAASEETVTFIGRLAQYRYYEMHQVITAALNCARALCNSFEANAPLERTAEVPSATAT